MAKKLETLHYYLMSDKSAFLTKYSKTQRSNRQARNQIESGAFNYYDQAYDKEILKTNPKNKKKKRALSETCLYKFQNISMIKYFYKFIMRIPIFDN